MNRIEEHFTKEKLDELKHIVKTTTIPPLSLIGHNWAVRELKIRDLSFARNALEVYEKRETIAKLALMIEELKAMGIQEKLDDIRKFARDNNLSSMVEFCPWGYELDGLDTIINSDPVEHAMKWMASDHSC